MTQTLLTRSTALLVLSALGSLMAHFDANAQSNGEEWVLPTIVKEGTPSDALKYDPIVPANEGGTTLSNGAGGISENLRTQIPFHILNNGRPGNVSSFIGIGRGSEETDVNALGIPLNGPQGGGFDLSSFPQYLWTGYSYQTGPSLGAFDPRGISGSLTLIPWTQQALTNSTSAARFTFFRTSANVNQVSAGAKLNDEVAALAGISDGRITGPAGSFSGRFGQGKLRGKYHLLATHQTAHDLASSRSGTTGKQLTLRYIPVLQLDADLSPNSILKTSFFFDSTYLRFDQDDNSVRSRRRSQTRQAGLDTAYIFDEWKIGVGLRRLTYQDLSVKVPAEYLNHSQATRSFQLGTVLLEPTLQIVAVSKQGFHPMGTVGLKKEFAPFSDSRAGLFARASYNKRFPSLVDRYYEIVTPFFSFRGNPNLKPEKVYTLTAGMEASNTFLSTTLEGYTQTRRDSRYQTLNTFVNAGHGSVSALMQSVSARPTAWLTLGNRLSLTKSHVEATQQDFTYLPAIMDVLSLDIHEARANSRWGITTLGRFSGKYFAPNPTDLTGSAPAITLPGYAYFDLNARLSISPTVTLLAGVENIADRKIEFVAGSPSEGRYYTVALTGQM